MFERNDFRVVIALLALAALPGIAAGQGDESTRPDGAAAEQQSARDSQTAAERQAELDRLQAELDRARREMEAAAREISRITATGPRPAFVGARRLPFGPASAAIGVNVENADAGALIVGVTPGGPADQSGVLSGDVIVGIDGNATVTEGRRPVDVVVSTLADKEPGTTVGLDIVRAGETMALEVVAGEAPRFARFISGLPGNPNFDWFVGDLPDLSDLPDLPDMPNVDLAFVRDIARDVSSHIDLSYLFASRWRDMELATLSEDLGSYFDTDSGLLVIRAPEYDELDLRDGDVILTIGGRTPTSPEHALRILSSFVPGERLELEIMRRQRRQTVEYTIPDPEAEAAAQDAR